MGLEGLAISVAEGGGKLLRRVVNVVSERLSRKVKTSMTETVSFVCPVQKMWESVDNIPD